MSKIHSRRGNTVQIVRHDGDPSGSGSGGTGGGNTAPEVSHAQVAEQLDQFGEAFAQFREQHEREVAEIRQHGEAAGETQQVLDRINTRLDEIETNANRPRVGNTNAEGDADREMLSQGFAELVRHGAPQSDDTRQALTQHGWAVDDNAQGGFVVPRPIRDTIIGFVQEISPVRQAAEVITISEGDSLGIPRETENDFEAGWVSERQSRPDTDAGDLDMVNIHLHGLYAQPKVTQKMLSTGGFDVEGYFAQRVSTRLGRLEGRAFVRGTDNGQPQGLVHAGTGIEQIKSGHATLLTDDGVLDLYHALKGVYAARASFFAARPTFGALRKLKQDGQYMYGLGFDGAPIPTLMGRPLVELPDMPTIAADALALGFGDLQMGYTIVDNTEMVFIRDPFTDKPNVRLYWTGLVGGAVTNPDAIKLQKIDD